MRIDRVVLWILLLASLPVFGGEKTDIIIMKNGDRMTGEVKRLVGGVLYVSFSYILGTSSVDWSQVAHLESKHLFIVKTEDGSIYRGTLNTVDADGSRPVSIEILDDSKSQTTVQRRQIVDMAETSENIWQRFNGAIDGGLTFTKGNDAVQYNLGTEVEYLRPRWSATAKWNSNLSSNSGSNPSTRNELTTTGRRFFGDGNYLALALGDFLQSSVQGIHLQTSLGGGVGRYFKNTNRANIAIVGGLAWQNVQYDASIHPTPTQDVVAAMVAGQMKLFWFNKTNLDVTALVFPTLNQPGRVKVNTNASYYIKLAGGLSWHVSFYGNWDNQPPPYFSGSDYGTSSGFSYSFGIK